MSGFFKKLGPGEMTSSEAIQAVCDGRLKRRPLTALDTAIDEIMARQIEAEYGERCLDFDEDCVTCRAWRDFDGARAPEKIETDTRREARAAWSAQMASAAGERRWRK